MTARSYRMAGRDRVWDGLVTVGHTGGVPMPSVEAVREALTWLGDRRPDHRLFCRIDRRRMHWVPVSEAERPAWIERLATAGPDGLQPTDPQPEEWAQLGPDEPQLQLKLFPHSYAVVSNHGFGDYSFELAVRRELFSAALTGRHPEALLRPGVRRPVLTAAWRTARSAGRPFLSALAARVDGGEAPADAAEPVRTSSAPGPAPFVQRHAEVPPDARARLAEWRTASGASEAAALFALTVAALDDLGAPRVPVVVLMDARSTLPRSSVVEGNLLAAIEVPRAQVASPHAFRQFTRDAYANGRVVAEVARGAAGQNLRALLRRPRRAAPVPGSPLTALTLSYLRNAPEPGDPLAFTGHPAHTGWTHGPGSDAALGLWFFSSPQNLVVGGSTGPRHAELLEALVERIAETPVDLIAEGAAR